MGKVRLIEARKRAGLGRPRCAALAGIAANQLYTYEVGKHKPRIKNAARVANVLGVKLDEIDEFRPALKEVEAAGLVPRDVHLDR